MTRQGIKLTGSGHHETKWLVTGKVRLPARTGNSQPNLLLRPALRTFWREPLVGPFAPFAEVDVTQAKERIGRL